MTEHQTTLLQLQEIFRDTRCFITPFFRIIENREYFVDCDEVYPNLFIGNGNAAKNKEYLNVVGITRVVNMAEGDVDTDANFYEDQKIKYLGISITDSPSTQIMTYFEIVSKFIADGLNSHGKVLVHCLMGYSRSATCGIAYLMICKGMSAVDACRTVKSKHVCRPNDGFLQQLVVLDNQLKCERFALTE